MQEGGKEVGIVYLDWKLDEDVLVSKIGLLETGRYVSCARRDDIRNVTDFSVVNLFSL